MKLSIIMPVWLRPQRTLRAIESVLAQDVGAWELLVVGDACPKLGTLDVSHPNIHVFNLPTHEGAWGTQCLNFGLELASGEYVSFLGNDDFVLPEYVRHRLESTDGGIYDLVLHNAIVATRKKRTGTDVVFEGHVRYTQPVYGLVGGSELVVRTSLARDVKFRSRSYGHDFTFFEDLLKREPVWGMSQYSDYVVTHTPGTGSVDEGDLD